MSQMSSNDVSLVSPALPPPLFFTFRNGLAVIGQPSTHYIDLAGPKLVAILLSLPLEC